MSAARERLLALRLELEARGEYAPAPPATVVAAGDALVVTAYAARVVKGTLCVTGEIQYLPGGHEGPIDTDALELEALERAFPGLTRTGVRPESQAEAEGAIAIPAPAPMPSAPPVPPPDAPEPAPQPKPARPPVQADDEFPPSEAEALMDEEPAVVGTAPEPVNLRTLPINTAPARPALDDPEPAAPDEPRGTEQVKSLARQALNALVPKCARDRNKAIAVAAARIREAFGVERSDELTEAQAAELLDWARRYRPPVVDDFDPNVGRRRSASPAPAPAKAGPGPSTEPSLDDRIMDVYLTECQGALDQEAEAAMIETGYARVSEAGAFETLPEGEVAEAVKVETLRRLEAVVKRATVLN